MYDSDRDVYLAERDEVKRNITCGNIAVMK
jgi:hypothetical protein